MTLRYRRMKPKDVATCVKFIADNPVVGPRYGTDFSQLASAVEAVLHLESVRAFTFEEHNDAGTVRPFACAIMGFITDNFLQRSKQPPYFWVGPEIARLTRTGKTPFLSDEQLREANALRGLNTTTWLWGISLRDILRPEIRMYTMEAFHTELRGFRLAHLMGQATGMEELESILRSGGLLLSATGEVLDQPNTPLEHVVRNPHLFVMTRELLASQIGSWTSSLFVYQEPRIGFSRSEQGLLEVALRGGTDEELARELDISLSAVKKTWRSVYAVREHPEELRPISMKALRKAQGQRGGGGLAGGEAMPRRRVVRARP
jgi:hypothetical protein